MRAQLAKNSLPPRQVGSTIACDPPSRLLATTNIQPSNLDKLVDSPPLARAAALSADPGAQNNIGVFRRKVCQKTASETQRTPPAGDARDVSQAGADEKEATKRQLDDLVADALQADATGLPAGTMWQSLAAYCLAHNAPVKQILERTVDGKALVIKLLEARNVDALEPLARAMWQQTSISVTHESEPSVSPLAGGQAIWLDYQSPCYRPYAQIGLTTDGRSATGFAVTIYQTCVTDHLLFRPFRVVIPIIPLAFGNYMDGKPHGNIVMRAANFEIDAEWQNGRCSEPISLHFGADGDYEGADYVGTIFSTPTGPIRLDQGELTDRCGSKFSGDFAQRQNITWTLPNGTQKGPDAWLKLSRHFVA